jgi:protoheme IX farnesyltransferase
VNCFLPNPFDALLLQKILKQINASIERNTLYISLKSIYIDFREITKARLAISVVFSSVAGFMLGIYDLHSLLDGVVKLALGGYCMVGASNAFNQIIEKDLDALMDRTKIVLFLLEECLQLRLLLQVFDGYWNCITLYNQSKTAMFGAISIFLYTSIYTPLKQ